MQALDTRHSSASLASVPESEEDLKSSSTTPSLKTTYPLDTSVVGLQPSKIRHKQANSKKNQSDGTLNTETDTVRPMETDKTDVNVTLQNNVPNIVAQEEIKSNFAGKLENVPQEDEDLDDFEMDVSTDSQRTVTGANVCNSKTLNGSSQEIITEPMKDLSQLESTSDTLPESMSFSESLQPNLDICDQREKRPEISVEEALAIINNSAPTDTTDADETMADDRRNISLSPERKRSHSPEKLELNQRQSSKNTSPGKNVSVKPKVKSKLGKKPVDISDIRPRKRAKEDLPVEIYVRGTNRPSRSSDSSRLESSDFETGANTSLLRLGSSEIEEMPGGGKIITVSRPSYAEAEEEYLNRLNQPHQQYIIVQKLPDGKKETLGEYADSQSSHKESEEEVFEPVTLSPCHIDTQTQTLTRTLTEGVYSSPRRSSELSLTMLPSSPIAAAADLCQSSPIATSETGMFTDFCRICT